MKAAVRERMWLLCGHLASIIRWWNGDEEYARYLQRAATRSQPALDRGRYFAQRLEERYRGPSRCC